MEFIGIDVSKKKLDCLWLKDPVANKVKSRVLPNTPAGHRQVIEWACKQTGRALEALHFVMEATGVYHEALAYALFDAGARVSVVNPARIQAYARARTTRGKTDKKDSIAIARYGYAEQPALWQPEAAEIRRLKALMRRLEALEKSIQQEENRLEKSTTSQDDAVVIASIQSVLLSLKAEKKRLEDLINDHIDSHPGLKQDKALLESIPGVGEVVARYMMTLFRSRNFERAGQMAAFVGLVPIERESGSSVRGRPRLSKAGSATIRAKLYLPAVVTTRFNPQIRDLYQRLIARGKSKMAAIGAAMRKLVHMCFGVLKHQQPYSPMAA